MKPYEQFKPKDLYDFVTGKGSAAWTQIWNEAYMTTVLRQQGIDVGTDIGRKALLKVLKGAEAQIGAGGTVKVDYAAFAQGAGI